MIKSRFSFFKWTPFVVLLAIAFTLSMRSSTAKSELSPAADSPPINVDLTNEERVLGKYLDDVVNYEHECKLIGQRARLVSGDLDSVQRRSSELKDRLTEVQNAFREVVRKLKAANEWDNLNTTLAARITDQKERRDFEDLNFKQLLDDGSNTLTNHSNEISGPFENLRRRVVSRTVSPYGDGAAAIVSAAYHPPAPPMFIASLKCLIASARMGIVTAMGNHLNPHSTDVQSCACNQGSTTGAGTGRPCSECC